MSSEVPVCRMKLGSSQMSDVLFRSLYTSSMFVRFMILICDFSRKSLKLRLLPSLLEDDVDSCEI